MSSEKVVEMSVADWGDARDEVLTKIVERATTVARLGVLPLLPSSERRRRYCHESLPYLDSCPLRIGSRPYLRISKLGVQGLVFRSFGFRIWG